MCKLKNIFLAFVIAITLPNIMSAKQIHAPIVEAQEVLAPLTPVEYADKYASQYGVDPMIFKKVMWCESGNNPKAVGDSGRARNVMQFHRPTFDSYAAKLGIELDYDSYHDQILLAAYMWSIGEERHWTTYLAIINGGVYIFTDRNGVVHTVRCK